MMDWWYLIEQGEYLKASISPYIAVIGGELFYTFIYLVTIALPYIKSRRIELSGILGMIYGAVLFVYFPADVRKLAFLFAALSLAVTLYSIVMKRGI